MTGNVFAKRSNIETKAKRIAFVHHKGGTGKTTACINIAGWLTKLNQKVLVIDLDPQANATAGLGVDLKSLESSMFDVLFKQSSLQDIILETHSGIYLAPASIDLLSIETGLTHFSKRESILKRKITVIDNLFDFILIDSPPGSNVLMMNGIVAAGNIIIPLDTGVFGFETLETLKTIIMSLEDDLNMSINIMMALQKVFPPFLFQFGFTNKIHKMITNYFAVNGLQDCSIFTIPFSKKICLAQMNGLPISHYAPRAAVSGVYKKIARDVLKAFNLMEKESNEQIN